MRCFNPRAPCGARPRICLCIYLSFVFQSTRPMRGATRHLHSNNATADVSIHAPHAGRDAVSFSALPPCGCFNPRAPCGARRRRHAAIGLAVMFQSTRPMRGATHDGEIDASTGRVSIHAPHAGRDFSVALCSYKRDCFNPRAPCGARHRCGFWQSRSILFQSTRPMRGATFAKRNTAGQVGVSIHAPHAGRDFSQW